MFLYIQDNIDPLVTSVSAVRDRHHRRLAGRDGPRSTGSSGCSSGRGTGLMKAANDYDVAVIGGGLVGSAIAWGLARKGQRVAVLDEGDVAVPRLARQLRAGLGAEQGPRHAAVRRLDRALVATPGAGFADALQAADRHRRRLPAARAAFTSALSERELEARVEQLKRLHNQPGIADYEIEILDHAAVEAVLPEIGPEVVGASYCPLDGHVQLAASSSARSTPACSNSASPTCRTIVVERIEHVRRRVPPRDAAAARSAPARSCSPPASATRAWRRWSASTRRCGPQRGQIIVTEKTAPFLHYPVVDRAPDRRGRRHDRRLAGRGRLRPDGRARP